MSKNKKQSFLSRLTKYPFSKGPSYKDPGFYSDTEGYSGMTMESAYNIISDSSDPYIIFNETKDVTLIKVEDILFSEKSEINAKLLWGEFKSGLFNKKSQNGLKKIIEDTFRQTDCLYTDVIICVHPDDYNKIRMSSNIDSTRTYDEAREEIDALKQMANHYFFEKNNCSPLIQGRQFHFEIKPYQFDELKNSFIVVLRKNTFIVEPGEKSLILADISVTYQGDTQNKPFYKDKRCFLIGTSEFDDITLNELPAKVRLAFSFDTGEFQLEYPIDYSQDNRKHNLDSDAIVMHCENDKTWLISPENTPDGINAKVSCFNHSDNSTYEIASIELTLHKSAKQEACDQEHVSQKPLSQASIPEPEPNDALQGIQGTVHIRSRAARKTVQEQQAIGQTRHIRHLQPKKPYKTLVRTHRFLPMPVDDEQYAAYFGGEGDWVVDKHDGAKILITWKLEEICLKPLVDSLLWNDEEWPKDDTRQLHDNFELVSITEKDSNFFLKLDSQARPLMTFDDGEKDYYHLACLDTEPDLIVPLYKDQEFITIGRGERCTINTSLDDFFDQTILRLELHKEFNQKRIKELQAIKSKFSFSSIMSSRYHAIFDHEEETVINLSDLPIFIFECDDNDNFSQKQEIPGLEKKDWCSNCVNIMKELNQTSVSDMRQFVDNRIFSDNGFIKCQECNEKRHQAEIKAGEFLVIGNAMYQYNKK